MKPRVDIGFTGSRNGMTMPQRLAALDWFRFRTQPGNMLDTEKYSVHIHHGCCTGADEEMALLGRFLNLWLVAHIPEKRDWMSMLAYEVSDFILPAQPFLRRDRNIVERSSHVVATPGSLNKNKSRGTWYTIDYAKQQGKFVTVIHPDGQSSTYGG